MSIPYEQLHSPKNTVARLPYMRLPSYKSLRRYRYHPYRTQLAYGPTDTTEFVEDASSEVDTLLDSANPNPVPFSLPMVLEDDCMAGLRTVVSQMIGQDSSRMRLGSVHLIIDFAFIVRRRRQSGTVATMTLPHDT